MVIYMGNNIEFIDLMNNEILKGYEKTFRKILKRVKKELKIRGKLGLSVTLCDDKHIQELNKTYRNKNMATDVLSFAIEDDSSEELKIYHLYGRVQTVDRGLGNKNNHIGSVMWDFLKDKV